MPPPGMDAVLASSYALPIPFVNRIVLKPETFRKRYKKVFCAGHPETVEQLAGQECFSGFKRFRSF
jgi:hypothetical protein